MASDNFRTLAFALRNVNGLDTYGVLNAADAVERTVEGMVAQGIEDYKQEQYTAQAAARATAQDEAQKVLNMAATTVPGALDYFNENRKINAIKEVRLATGAGLKAAKDAVESEVFATAAEVHAKSKREFADLRALRTQAEWDAYRSRMDNWCCEDCNGVGTMPQEPLAEWERELLSGN